MKTETEIEYVAETILVHADQAWVIDQKKGEFACMQLERCLEGDKNDLGLRFQHMLFPAALLEPWVIERRTGLDLASQSDVYKTLDCGLFGRNYEQFGYVGQVEPHARFDVVIARFLLCRTLLAPVFRELRLPPRP